MTEVFLTLYGILRSSIQVNEMRRQAYTDELTGLKNRRAYIEDIENED